MNDNKIIVQVDKTVVRITGLDVKGLNIQELEQILKEKLKSVVRIIGVTGSSIEMDVYGIEEDAVLKDEDGFIKAVALAEGITVNDITQISSINKAKCVDFNNLPQYKQGQCMEERWLNV